MPSRGDSAENEIDPPREQQDGKPSLPDAAHGGAPVESRVRSSAAAVSEAPLPVLQRDALLLAAIILCALVIRVVYILQLRSSPLFEDPILDAELHHRWAMTLADGGTLFKGAYFRAPFYPWLLSMVYRMAGPDFLIPRLAQAVLGALSCGLLYLLGRDTLGKAVGAIAGFTAATYWVFVYFDAELLLEPVSIFLNLLATWLFVRAAMGKSPLTWAASGIIWGLSAINRPNVLVIMLALAIWILFAYRSNLRDAFRRAALFSVACAIPILPITIRNYVVGDDFVLIASQAGANFYIGNNPQSNGWSAVMPGARTTWMGGYQDWITIAEQAAGRKLKPSEVSRYFFRQTWEFMRSRPLEALNLMLAKVQIFFYEWEITNNKNLYFFTRHYTPIISVLPVTFGIVAPLGLVGMFLARREAMRLFPLWGFAVLYTATVIAFFVTARFRAPVVPFFILFAAHGAVQLCRAVKAGNWRFLGMAGVALALLVMGVNRGVPQAYLKDAMAYCQVGWALMNAGRTEEGLEAFRAGQTLDPDSFHAEKGLGHGLFRIGDYEEAIEHYRRALKLNPAADVHENLAQALVSGGRWGEAFGVLRQGLKVTPGYLDLKRKMAYLLATCPFDRMRDGRTALKLAEDVRRFRPERPETYDTLAVVYADLSRFPDAIAAAEQALALARRDGNLVAVEAISQHLKLFRQGRPFRQSPAPQDDRP